MKLDRSIQNAVFGAWKSTWSSNTPNDLNTWTAYLKQHGMEMKWSWDKESFDINVVNSQLYLLWTIKHGHATNTHIH